MYSSEMNNVKQTNEVTYIGVENAESMEEQMNNRGTHHTRTLTLIRTWRKAARWWREKAAGISAYSLGFEQRKIAKWYDLHARELYREVLSK
jgi:hypothetical protein